APHVDEAWTLLMPSLALASSKDDAVAGAALRAARRITAQLTSGADFADVPRDLLQAASRTLVRIARTTDLPGGRRAEAVGLATMLAGLAAPPRADLLALAQDGTPEVKRAAIDALARDPAATPVLARTLAEEPQAPLAAAAAAAVCGRIART